MDPQTASASERDVAVLAEQAEAEAWTDWYDAAPPPVRAAFAQSVVKRAGATLLLAPGLPFALFNRVIGLGLEKRCNAADLARVQATYRAAGVSSWVLQWNPAGRPVDLPSIARAAGFGPATSAWAKMWRGGGPVPPVTCDYAVGEVLDDETADSWAEAVAAGNEMPPLAPWLRALYGRPGWRLYAARDGGRVVGGGALFLRGDRAWLGMGAVRPSHRRRHVQQALMARRVADALEAGATRVFTETGEPAGGRPSPSLDNMLQCGFVRAASRINLPGPKPAAAD